MNLPLLGMVLAPGLPLLLAGAMVFSATHSAALRLAPWAALPALILAVFAPTGVSLHLPWLLLGTELGLVDDTGRLFLLFTALLWWLAGMYARAYLSGQRRVVGRHDQGGSVGLVAIVAAWRGGVAPVGRGVHAPGVGCRLLWGGGRAHAAGSQPIFDILRVKMGDFG